VKTYNLIILAVLVLSFSAPATACEIFSLAHDPAGSVNGTAIFESENRTQFATIEGTQIFNMWNVRVGQVEGSKFEDENGFVWGWVRGSTILNLYGYKIGTAKRCSPFEAAAGALVLLDPLDP